MRVSISHDELVQAVLTAATDKVGVLPIDATVEFRWGDPNIDEITAVVVTPDNTDQ